jgi:hypothetical protein
MAGAGWLTGHPGRKLSLRRVFVGSDRRRVWLTPLVDRTIGAHRRLLRRVARRPATAAAMTPGFWRLGIPRIAPGMDLRVLNLTARQWRSFRCGFIHYRRSLRDCRRRGAAAASPTTARLVGFAVCR